MPITRSRYLVALNATETTEAAEHEVTVTHGDRMRAELEARKHGLPRLDEAPLNHTALWVWCGMVRAGQYAGDFRDFKLRDLDDLEPIRDAEGEPEVEPVDPTRPAAPSA